MLFILLLETLALPYFSDLIKFVVALMGFRSARKVLKQEIFDILERGRALHSKTQSSVFRFAFNHVYPKDFLLQLFFRRPFEMATKEFEFLLARCPSVSRKGLLVKLTCH